MSPPRIKGRGLRGMSIPQGYVLGRSAHGTGDAQLIRVPGLGLGRGIGGGGITTVTSAPATLVPMVASISLSGHRVVKANASGQAAYPNTAVLADALAVVGITTGAISSGNEGDVQVGGYMDEPSWTWTPGGPIYCADTGVLAQSLPAGVWLLQVATAITATRIVIEPRTVISSP